MMKKELFLESLKNLKSYTAWEHKLYELGVNFWECEEVSKLIDNYISLLEYCCHDNINDKYVPSDICYFIYDCEWGKESDKYTITINDEKTGEERIISLKDEETLWDWLVECHPEIEDKEGETNEGN